MASSMCELMIFAIFFQIPNGMDFRPQRDTSQTLPNIAYNMETLNNNDLVHKQYGVTHSEGNQATSQVSMPTRFRGRQRRRKPISQPTTNTTVVVRGADGKRRIVYYNTQTSQYVNLMEDQYGNQNNNNYFYVGNRGKRGNVQPKTDNTDKIVFPGPAEGVATDMFQPKVPGTCKETLGICTAAENYPTMYVESILSNSALSFQEFNGTDEIDSLEIGQRIDYNDEAPLCGSNENIIFPKAGRNKDYKLLFIVNQPKFIQGVRVETCQNENEECAYSQNFPSGYKSMCKQKYIYRKMLAIDNSGEQIVDNFRLPSCCSCVLHSLDLTSKSGFDPTRQSRAIRRGTRAK